MFYVSSSGGDDMETFTLCWVRTMISKLPWSRKWN